MLLMIAAGPAVNVILLVASAWFLFAGSSPLSGIRASSAWTVILISMLIVNGITLLGSLVPMKAEIRGRSADNDGLKALRVLAGSDPFINSVEGQLKNRPSDETRHESGNPWPSTINAGQISNSLEEYRLQIQRDDLPEGLRHHLRDAFATLVLMAGASEFLDEADRYSDELYQARGGEWTVKGTRGGVLVEKGRLEEGIRLLREVMDNDPSSFDRAISASYLGLAEIKLGRPAEAQEWLTKARRCDPRCVFLQRFEKMLQPE